MASFTHILRFEPGSSARHLVCRSAISWPYSAHEVHCTYILRPIYYIYMYMYMFQSLFLHIFDWSVYFSCHNAEAASISPCWSVRLDVVQYRRVSKQY